MELASNISVDRYGLLINGQRLPFLISTEPIEVRTADNEIPTVRVTLLAETVAISPLLKQEADGDVVLVTEPEFDGGERA